MTSTRLVRAGWLSFANAALTIPLFMFSLLLGPQGGYGAMVVNSVIMVISTLFFMYIMLTLLDYLHSRYSFYDSDLLIKIQLWINVTATIFSMLGLLSQDLGETLNSFDLVLVIPSGVVQALFGYRLLRLNELDRRLKGFCLLNIITGVSVALIITIPVAISVGLVTSAAADVLLGMIFLAAGRIGEPA